MCCHHSDNSSLRPGPSCRCCCSPRSDQNDRVCGRDDKAWCMMQSFLETSLRLQWHWLIAAGVGLSAIISVKWTAVLIVVWICMVVVLRKCGVSIISKLVQYIRGRCHVHLLRHTACYEAPRALVRSKLHEDAADTITHKNNLSTWDTDLFKYRKFQDREFFAVKESLKIDRDDLDYFLEPNPSVIPSWKVECIKRFCSRESGPHMNSKEPLTNTNALSARAWVAIETRHQGSVVANIGMFCPSELGKVLKGTRPGKSAHIDAYRQLIHITQLDEQYIRILAKTAWYHQAEALRDGIYNHVNRQASLRVYIPYSGFKVFQFECHLPYLALRKRGPSTAHHGRYDYANSRKSWRDISFLNLDFEHPNNDGTYVICERHSSLIMSGWDETKWAAYGFTNADFSDEEIEMEDKEEPDQVLDEKDSVNLDNTDGDYDVYAADSSLEDHLASDGKENVVLREHPICDPRLYFLQVTDARLNTVRGEWSYLVDKVIASVNNKNDDITYPFSSTPFSGTLTVEMSLAWLTKIMTFLSELRQELLVTIQTCEHFLAPNGDHTYFYNEGKQALVSPLRDIVGSIQYSFMGFILLEKRLTSLEKSCQSSKDIIELCTINQHPKENLMLNTEAKMLSRQGNTLSREANELSREANLLAREANEIAAENRKVAAANNLNAALMVNMNQFMTPVVVVVGYFSIEEEIFGFRKTAKSFLISVAILFVVLYVVSLVTFLLRQHLRTNWVIVWILTGQLDQVLLDRRETRKEQTTRV